MVIIKKPFNYYKMKKTLLTLILLIFTTTIFSQEDIKTEKISVQNKDNLFTGDTIYAAFAYLKENTQYIAKIDGNNVFLDNKSGDFINYKFTIDDPGTKKIILTKITDEKNLIVDSLSITVKKQYEMLKINSITITEFKNTKSDGRAWDNMISGTYPDVYVEIRDLTLNKIIKQTGKVTDLKPTQTQRWKFDQLIITKNSFKNTFTIGFYDDDSVTNDDLIGGTKLETIKGKLNNFFNEASGIQKFDIDKFNCSFEIDYQWF